MESNQLETICRKRTHEEMTKCNEDQNDCQEQTRDLLDLVEESKIELDKIMLCFKDPNKLSSVNQYLSK